MKYSWFIREELSAYKAHVTHSAKHLSQEHTGSCFYKNKFHNGFKNWYLAMQYPIKITYILIADSLKYEPIVYHFTL